MVDGRRIKLACRETVGAAGGYDSASGDLAKSITQIGRYCDPNTPGNFMTIEQVAILAEVGGSPAVASYLARLTGHALFALPAAPESEEAVSGAMIAASAEFGGIARELREATGDGDLSRADCTAIRRQIDEAIAALLTMRVLVGEG